MNIFLFNKALRCYDNTTLIHQVQSEGSVTPIFIFTDQINKSNPYYNSNSIQFMIESLTELYNNIKFKYKGELYFFKSDDFIKVFIDILKTSPINSIGTNFDYSPYAKMRQIKLRDFCNDNNIKFYIKEDHLLYNILDGKTLKSNGSPYIIFTPFKNYCLQNLKTTSVSKFNNIIKFTNENTLLDNIYYLKIIDIKHFYTPNENISVKGSRIEALKILKQSKKYNDYTLCRNFLMYNTTQLGAYNHFGLVSIREVYKAFKNNSTFIEQLIWRDFYYNIFYYFPFMLEGQINKINKPFKRQFRHIKWNTDEQLFSKWCNGLLGIPISDAGMRQLNKTGFMHNRLRMITAAILTKVLLIPWQWGEKYFAQKLTDYDCIQNGGGWAWTCHGIDPRQPYRNFSPKLQGEKYDKNAEFIKTYIPELLSVPAKDIHNWQVTFVKYKNIKYPEPQFDYNSYKSNACKEYLRVKKYSVAKNLED